MCGWREWTWRMPVAVAVALIASAGAAQERPDAGIGTPLSAAEIAAIDRDVRFDGDGLPAGSGTVAEGEELYAERCAACHGEFAEGSGRTPALLGGEGTLATDAPARTIGSFWPYAPTVFDYIRRAMPEGHAFSLTPGETFALTAFLLHINGVVEDDFSASAESLEDVRMPNRDGFVMPPHPTAQGTRCMQNCRKEGPRIAAEAPVTMEGIMIGDREEQP